MKKHLTIWSRKLHQMLVWVALLALLAFVLSALTHPIMVWTGPQAKQFMPPQMQLDASLAEKIPSILSQSNIEKSLVAKVVPTQAEPMLQLTIDEKLPRRYFSLNTGAEVANHDKQQAIWLARYYTGEASEVSDITLITEFSNEYPWVNRLIPVYKVAFNTDDNLTAFVYTETNALAGLNNNWKRSLQTVFQTFHTWAWLDNYPILRIAIISILLSSLLVMLLCGLVMLLLIKRKQFKSKAQSYHRKFAWVLLIPLAGFLFSAFYHLYQYEYGNTAAGMRLAKAINLQDLPQPSEEALKTLAGKSLNSFSLVQDGSNAYYRASLASQRPQSSHKPHAHHSSTEKRNQRFDGISKEKGAIFIPLNNNDASITDQALAQKLASDYLNTNDNEEITIKKVTHFGQGYDFRNKRLPVYKAMFKNSGDHLFIDPTTGILVDHSIKSQRLEGLSFSILHKWNIMLAFTDRQTRDIAIVCVLVLMLLFTAFGFTLRKR